MDRQIFNPHNITLSPEAAKTFSDKPKNASVIWGRPQISSTYGGTANPNQVVKRRAKNKVAAQSRKKNR